MSEVFRTTRKEAESYSYCQHSLRGVSVSAASFLSLGRMIKHLVSKNKLRWMDGVYDLDLSYVTDRIIAMGFPSSSSSLESMYRNCVEDVQMFLDERHPHCYKVYNLCSERCYDSSKFHGRVSVYPFDDHNPPEFGLILAFCRDVSQWLEEDPDHVAAVHCKAGKGRTGLMICAFLLYSGMFKTSAEVLEYYGSKRTSDCKGVTIPSQRRYVDYFAVLRLSEGLEYTPVKLLLTEIVLEPPPHVGFGHHQVHLQFEVLQHHVPPFQSKVQTVTWEEKKVVLKVCPPLLINGDVKIVFTQKMNVDVLHLRNKPKFISHVPHSKLFHFWVNTCFINMRVSSDLSHHVTSCQPPPEPQFTSQVSFTPTPLSNRFAPLSPPEDEDVRASSLRDKLDPHVSDPVMSGRDGAVTAVRLQKHHIDKASKDNTDRFPEDFSVTLLVIKPDLDHVDMDMQSSSQSDWSMERKYRLRN